MTMPDLTREDVARLRELMAKATPGEWFAKRATKYTHLRAKGDKFGDHYIMEGGQRGIVHVANDAALPAAGWMVAEIMEASERDGAYLTHCNVRLRVYNGYVPAVGDSIYTTPQPSAAEDDEACRCVCHTLLGGMVHSHECCASPNELDAANTPAS